MASNESSLLAISDLFQAADKDRNGNLSRDEIAGIMRQIKKGGLPTDAEVNMCMSMMDRDSDGVITKEEFTSAMAKWLVGTPYNPCTCNPFPFSADTNLQGLSSASTADIASPSGKNRRRGVSDLAKFFKQFDTVSDFGAQQELILQRERPEIDHSVLLHEFPVVPKERKLEIHRGISAIVAAGKTCLLAELHSTDWNVVLGAVHKVRDLLSIVEVFHDPDERSV